jgi:cytochrome c-type biogenesis protein CcmF
MIPELGQFALIIALCLSLVQAFFPLAGAWTGNRTWARLAWPAVSGQTVFVLLSFCCLVWSFIENDFSVLYVASHSNSALPLLYRISATWGAHEGSMLLWIVFLAGWSIAVAALSRKLPEMFTARVIGVLGLISFGFLLFTLETSNPFERLIPAAMDGRDLNPLLQDPGLAIHPPMLYMGYVGFAVAFAFAIAAMLEGKMDAAWSRWVRPWTTVSWCFLTLGIALGSWWAYYELGWGGWWFWDPVENASFMPWLAGTALIHSLAVTEKRGLFKSWTLLLAITAFSLSLLGTFLVRSGVLVSVHAFATDPERGKFILAFLAVVIGSALGLYAWRAPLLKSDEGFGKVSRETFLLANNLLLVVALLVVLLGTLFPLFMDAIGGGKYSVGPQYFAAVFVIPTLPLVFLLGLGMHSIWRRDNLSRITRRLRVPMLLAVVAGVALPWMIYGTPSVLTVVAVIAGLWVIGASLYGPVTGLLDKTQKVRITRSQWGMIVAHVGVGVFILGVTITEAYSVHRDQSLRLGDSVDVSGYTVTFESINKKVSGPNYQAKQATMAVSRDGKSLMTLYPEKRTYRVQRNPMTEAGIDARLHRDLYLALGDELGDNAWSVRFQYKPLVRFIWLGCIIMALGGLIAVSDKRYRVAVEKTVKEGGREALAGGTS